MDYAEEQKNEIEALESIYFDEFEIVSDSPVAFTIRVKSDESVDYSNTDQPLDGLACSLKVTYTADYPDSLPSIEIEDSEGLTETDEEDLLKCIIQYGEENLGMVMVFSFVSCAQDWLNNKFNRMKLEKDEEIERRTKMAEEEEMKRFEGTRVTVESFLLWKTAFDEEFGIFKKEKEKENKKATGRELFMLDQTLNESDLKFLADANEQITVDESLFQELDDLSLDDDFDDEDQ